MDIRPLMETKRIIRSILLWVRGVHSLNYVIARHLHRYLPLFFHSVMLPNHIKVYINDDATLSINICDMYERKEYFLHRDFIPRKGWIVVDVGAYVGIYSLWTSKVVGDEGLVIAFEPNPLAHYWLINNIRLNKVRNIIALPFALGDVVSEARLYVAKENIGASSLIDKHVIQNSAAKYAIATTFEVPLITLDYILEKAKSFINRYVRHIDLVKIDVEGYELKVLEGARKTLKRGVVKRFIIEVHTDQVSTEDIVRHLEYYGFHIVDIKNGIIKDIIYAKHYSIV